MHAELASPYRHVRAGAAGSATTDGVPYHDIPDYPGRVARAGTRERVEHLLTAVDVDGLRGLDIGCGPGGVSIELARRGAHMVAVDHDLTALAVGAEVAAAERLPVQFLGGDVAELVPGLLTDVDFVVWLSQWMWTVKAHGADRAEELLAATAAAATLLLFETAQGPGDGMAGTWGPNGVGGVRDLLSRHYPTVVDLGPSPGRWEGGRHAFVAARPLRLSGRVATGFGSAGADVAAGWYDQLPYEPYRGTLNLVIEGGVPRLPDPVLVLDKRVRRRLLLWPARVADVDCHLMLGGDAANVVELLAPVRLRDALGVVDGEEVTVKIVEPCRVVRGARLPVLPSRRVGGVNGG